MEFSKEMLEKAKETKSVEELIALAKENQVELLEESAKAYFELLQAQTKTGELSDEELDNVSGGGCHAGDGRLVVTVGNSCDHWKCEHCGSETPIPNGGIGQKMCNRVGCYTAVVYAVCGQCVHCSYENALWLCNHPANRS